jgi:hypothetical protein
MANFPCPKTVCAQTHRPYRHTECSEERNSGWCGPFARPARRPGALAVMPSMLAVSEGSGRGEEVN